jgi:hypothetical protein
LTVTQNGTIKEYGLSICSADYNKRWIKKFFDAFIALPEWRENFASSEIDPKQIHETVDIELKEGTVAVDKEIAAAIKKLNDQGIETAFSCQGGNGGPIAYIVLKKGSRFPEELLSAWRGAGWQTNGWDVHADGLFGQEDINAQRFVQSLKDWVNGELDTSGQKYRVLEPRINSLPKIPPFTPPVDENNTLEIQIKRIIKKGRKAKFSDLTRLRSGRDRYSTMPLEQLAELAGEAAAKTLRIAFTDDGALASAMRWVLRGLPPQLAIKKVKADQTIAANAKKQRR